MQKLHPGSLAHAVWQRQQAVRQAWEALQLSMDGRRTQLEQACLVAHFHALVRVPSPLKGVCVCMCARVYVYIMYMH